MLLVAVAGGASGAIINYVDNLTTGKINFESLKNAAISGAIIGVCGLFINSPRNKKDAPTQGAPPTPPVK